MRTLFGNVNVPNMDGWRGTKTCTQTVVRGKAAYLPEDKFKLTSSKIPLFLSNVHKNTSTSESDIVEYVYSKTKEKVVLPRIKMKTEKEYNAFKIIVCNNKLEVFRSDELWPAGITCRSFRPYKHPKSDKDGNINHSKQL